MFHCIHLCVLLFIFFIIYVYLYLVHRAVDEQDMQYFLRAEPRFLDVFQRPLLALPRVDRAEQSFKTIAVIPVALFFIFGAVWLFERRRKG